MRAWKMGYLLKVNFWYTESRRRRTTLQYALGADLPSQYLKFVKRHKIYNDIVLSDAEYLPFASKIFETNLFLEVIKYIVKKKRFLN
jgi:hypothetical protein